MNKSWATAPNLHLDMNPVNYLGNGEGVKENRSKIMYDKLSNFIYENNQVYHEDGIQLQGVLNLVDNTLEDGGYQCVPAFHIKFDEYFKDFKLFPKFSSFSFSKNAIEKLAIRITMREGSVVIWDQRLPHGSLPNNSKRIRAAQFFKILRLKMIESEERRIARRNKIGEKIWKIYYETGMEFPLNDIGRIVFDLPKDFSSKPNWVKRNEHTNLENKFKE